MAFCKGNMCNCLPTFNPVTHRRFFAKAIKTRGESVAVVLGLIGARPVTEGTGRVARYDAWPNGRKVACTYLNPPKTNMMAPKNDGFQ